MNIFESPHLIDKYFPVTSAHDLSTGENTGKAGTALRLRERVKEISLTPSEEEKYFFNVHGKDLYYNPGDIPPMDAKTLFNATGSLSWDIGAGRGERLISLATQHPEQHFVGVESHYRSALIAARAAADAGLDNLRFIRADAKLLMQKIPDGSSQEIALLFPAPQHDRKGGFVDLLQPSLATDIARVLENNARFEFATDSEPYFNVKMRMMGELGLFSCDLSDVSHQIEQTNSQSTKVRTRYQNLWESKQIPTHRSTMQPLKH